MMFAIHDSSLELKQNKGAFVVTVDDAAKLNKQGYGIFFSVNNFKGPRRETNLSKLNFFFVEIDSMDLTKQFDLLISFEIGPTIVNRSKNGLHILWRINGDCDLDIWKKIEKRLQVRFKADKNAIKVTQLLRMPGYYHMKDPNDPFPVRSIFESNNTVTAKQMLDVFPEEPSKPDPSPHIDVSIPNDDFWVKQAKLDCSVALMKLSGAVELRGDTYQISSRHDGKQAIFANNKLVQSCWIDKKGQIGSHSNGGPTIANWVRWYGYNWDECAEILKKYIPELKELPLKLDFS